MIPFSEDCGRISSLTVLRAVDILRRVRLAVLRVREPVLLRLRAAHETMAHDPLRGEKGVPAKATHLAEVNSAG